MQIDLNRLPIIKDPGRWQRIEHYPGGSSIPWDPARMMPYGSVVIDIHGLEGKSHVDKPAILADIAHLPVANKCVLDFAMADPRHNMPEYFRQWVWHFPATILYEKKGLAFVPCIFWTGESWIETDTLLQTYTESDIDVADTGVEPMTMALYLGSEGLLREVKTRIFH